MDLAPLIVTATLSPGDQRHFDALRRLHFPPERNHLAAHLTLFHHLPPARFDELRTLLRQLAADGPPAAQVTGVYSLGRGVAYHVDAPAMLALRERVGEWFAADLTPQDQAQPRLHITVQNKVEPAVAKALLAELAGEFVPRPLAITGFAVHHYRGGPWETAAQIGFRGSAKGGAHARY